MLDCIKVKEPKKLYEPFEYIMTGGGKRLRPVLTVFSAGAVGNNPEDAIDPGIAIEILHNFTLAHDDIMDESPTRRGKETIHKKWDKPTAILVGDMMVGFAYNLLPRARQHKRADEIHTAFTNGLIEVCEGQAYDMQFNQRTDVTFEEYFNMISLKTAKLIETSAVIGAHVGLGSDDEVEKLRNYAKSLGIAFQLQDDLLDISSTEAEFGKSIGQDIIEGKKTYLILKTMQKLAASSDDYYEYKKIINRFYLNDGLDRESIPIMQRIFKELGIYEDIAVEIESQISRSIQSLSGLKQNTYTDALRWLVENLKNRKF